MHNIKIIHFIKNSLAKQSNLEKEENFVQLASQMTFGTLNSVQIASQMTFGDQVLVSN